MSDSSMDAAGPSTVTRDAASLVFRGALVRAAVASLWRQSQPLRGGAQRLDLGAVTAVDSAGLALLAALAGEGIEVIGTPAGLSELRAAYRLDERLGFAG